MSFNLAKEAAQFDATNDRHIALNARLSPGYALDIVSRHNYEKQRPFSTKHAQRLAEAMRRSEFREYTSIDFAVLNGEPILINGQHTLRAISVFASSFWLSAHLHKASTAKDVERLYDTFDIGRTRTIRDVMGSTGEDLGLMVKERDALATAVGHINLGLRPAGGKDDPVRIYESKSFGLKKSLMFEWANEAKTFFRAIDPAPGFNKELFYRGHVLAVALLTIRHAGESACDFWSGTAIDDGLRNGDPRKALINWLRNNPAAKSVGLQHRAAIACWNAWHKDRTLNKVYPDTKGALKILGTPIEITEGRQQQSFA